MMDKFPVVFMVDMIVLTIAAVIVYCACFKKRLNPVFVGVGYLILFIYMVFCLIRG